MEPSNTGTSRAKRVGASVNDTGSKVQQIRQSPSAIGEKNQQDLPGLIYNNPEDSSSSIGVDSYEEVDEIDPDDSVSATGKQPPSHRAKRSALHMKNIPQQHHQQRTQPVASSISESYNESMYSGRGFFRPPPQGVTGWVPPPVIYYGNAGYMPPSQENYTTPYWQLPPYEKGKEMMPYPMWNPFAPGQGAWPSAAATVRKKSHRARKRSPKGKERHASIHALGAESRPDRSTADRSRPGKGSGKSGGDMDVLRLATDVDAVYSSAEAKNLTVHLEFDLFRDLDEELEEFNRLARMGDFAAADSFFESHLKEHMSTDPAIFVQYAEMLLDKGDFKSLLLLDGDSVFGRRRINGPNNPETSKTKEPLEMNWMLIRARTLIHSQHELHKVWSGIETPLPDFSTRSGIGSTELRNFSTVMRLTCLAPDRSISRNLTERDLSDWADWKSVYRQLLAEQRIWDFRDVLIDACVSYDTDQALNAFCDHASPIEGMVADWQTGTPGESTALALLDILSFIALRSDQSLDDGGLVGDSLRLAEPIGNSLLDKFPRAVHSRPFIQWLVSKAVVVKNGPEHFSYLSDYAGLAICPKSAGGLAVYIPIRQENPGWVPQELTTAARDVLQAALKASRDMKDYQTETLCLKSLALGAGDPVAYFQQLGQLQKTQGNMAGFLSTCLTRYLICQDDESKEALLEDLNSFGSWRNESDLVNPVGAAGRDVLQHALSRGSAKNSEPSIMSASKYSSHLPEHFQSIFRHLERPQHTETSEEYRPPTETSPPAVEQNSESEDEQEERPQKSTRSRNIYNNVEFRDGNMDEIKGKHQSAAPGFYPGPWPNYGMPPYYPMNMMYGAQPPPPPPTEPVSRPPPPPSAAEQYRPNPEMELMKKQLELLKAERREQEKSKKRADMEQRIREDAERAFKIRMEEMLKAQDEAKKEIELAKIAAERAARERIEEDRKAEAERQRQHAEMIAKAERDARDRIEKERREEQERQRQHTEGMAQAERSAKEKYQAALKAEEEQRWREEEMRKKMREEMREEMRNEVREEMRALVREERERMEGERAGEEKERGRRRSTS